MDYEQFLDSKIPKLYEIFHEKTKVNKFTNEALSNSVFQFYLNTNLFTAAQEAYKVYPYNKKYPLKKNEYKADFIEVLKTRRSLRDFEPYHLSFDELSNLLYYTYGNNIETTLTNMGMEIPKHLRFVPSAGGLYPLDVYLALLSPADIPAGLYHYNVIDHSVELLNEGDFHKEMVEYLPSQFSLDTAAGVFFISATFSKSTIKYGDRGYRFTLLDAGHLMQNVYLVLTSLGLSCYGCGGLLDFEIDNLFALDGNNETIIYCAPFGKPKSVESLRNEDEHVT